MYGYTFAAILAVLPATLAATHDVSVGAGGKLVFDPEFVTAHVGDIVNFVFHPKNHTVTQSSFDQPCVPLHGGFDSGFMPVSAETEGLPNYQVHVTEESPVWVHCQQKGHCGQGMVFAINAPADPSPKSFKAFKDLAIATNGTESSTSTAPPETSATYITPPAPHWESATATVTLGSSVWTTTYTSYDGTPPPTPAAEPVDHKVIVGADGQLSYNPANISAAIGDTVTFEFRPKNHTVTQSSFLNPCKPLADTSTTGQVGFKSGFRPVTADATEFPQFKITINDTAPIWGYCGQGNHCNSGMVFSINAVESGPNNFAAFVELAKRSDSTSSATTGTDSNSPKPTSGAVVGLTTPYKAALGLGALATLFIAIL
ncbi:hypothetical protein D9615_007498 [Tricholomella constricta]|uniref:Cupredoxin n=1 Tax=Tricholomella constricta TaxID=117010 RepID=A0A8H5M2E0_9AGAR|nr:hypothetical protein D9615_007498 [Tricholomella constricta]